MKNLFSSLRGKLCFAGLAPFLLTAPAFGSSYDSAVISFLEESHLSISAEAKRVLFSCVSNDRNSTGWAAEVASEDTVYAVEAIPVTKAQIKSVQNSNNASAMRRSLSRATLRLALFLDNGKLDRKAFPELQRRKLCTSYVLQGQDYGRHSIIFEGCRRLCSEPCLGKAWKREG